MRLAIRTMFAAAGLSVALTLAWVTAFVAFVAHHEPPASRLVPPSLDAPATRRELPASSLERPYVATEIGKAYHLADSDCFYIRKQSKHTLIPLTAEEAKARGLPPCTNCLPQQIARSK